MTETEQAGGALTADLIFLGNKLANIVNSGSAWLRDNYPAARLCVSQWDRAAALATARAPVAGVPFTEQDQALADHLADRAAEQAGGVLPPSAPGDRL